MKSKHPKFIVIAGCSALTSLVLGATGVNAQTGEPAGMYAAPDEEQDTGQSYVTTAVIVRIAPNTRARATGRLKRGDFVNVGECQGTWCEVDAYGGSGWIQGRFIGHGANPYHDLGPAGPSIPKQEPGTRSRRGQRPTEGQM